MSNEDYDLPSYKEWAIFLANNMPPPGTKCQIECVKGGKVIVRVTQGKYKNCLFTADFFYNTEAYKHLPKPKRKE